MADTTFVNGATLTDADWFNDVNRLHYTIFGDPADDAAARTGISAWGAKGADVASASALTLLTDGNYFDITGTTAITSIGTLGVGTVVKLHFDAALTLTHHATDLILPGAANITTAAGDEAEFVEYATGDWRCTNYSDASSRPFPYGTITNDSAAAGEIGEYVESVVGVTSAPTTAQYGDLTSISLTAGDWDISLITLGILNGATCTFMLAGIGTSAGNNGAGCVYGDTQVTGLATSNVNATLVVPPKRVALAASATYYLKMYAAYSAGTPQFQGRISARRVR